MSLPTTRKPRRRRHVVSATLSRPVINQLDRLARAEMRNRSNMVQVLVEREYSKVFPEVK